MMKTNEDYYMQLLLYVKQRFSLTEISMLFPSVD